MGSRNRGVWSVEEVHRRGGFTPMTECRIVGGLTSLEGAASAFKAGPPLLDEPHVALRSSAHSSVYLRFPNAERGGSRNAMEQGFIVTRGSVLA